MPNLQPDASVLVSPVTDALNAEIDRIFHESGVRTDVTRPFASVKVENDYYLPRLLYRIRVRTRLYLGSRMSSDYAVYHEVEIDDFQDLIPSLTSRIIEKLKRVVPEQLVQVLDGQRAYPPAPIFGEDYYDNPRYDHTY